MRIVSPPTRPDPLYAAFVLAALVGGAAAPPLTAQAPTLTPADYGQWESLGAADFDPTGRWVVLRREENQVDYQTRILEWFGHYLKGDPAPSWIVDGENWEQRARRIGR